MKTLYFNLSMGAAGDMISAALLELLPDPSSFVDELNALGIPDVVYSMEPAEKCGIKGTRMSVKISGEEEKTDSEISHCHDGNMHCHSHNSLKDIEHIINSLSSLPETVKKDVLSVYTLIAGAESEVHGVPVSEIHFHEVGAMDAIADITAVCLLMHRLKADKVFASPIHVGSGQVKCAHGILPVPAPATAKILRNVPIFGGAIEGELCTPTGAALLVHFVDEFGNMPVMKVCKIGYGMGKKDFGTANCICAMLGQTEDLSDSVVELSCNVDDMTAEKIAFACDRLFDAGALDVYTIPVTMKKSRPGTLIRVMCRERDKDSMVREIFKHTTTIGIRQQIMQRYTLDRKFDTVATPYGKIRRKIVSGYGTERFKYEFDDLACIAKENSMSLSDVEKMANDNC